MGAVDWGGIDAGRRPGSPGPRIWVSDAARLLGWLAVFEAAEGHGPVDALNGAASVSRTDLSVPQPWGQPVAFERTYSSAPPQGAGSTTEVGALGPGWSHSSRCRGVEGLH